MESAFMELNVDYAPAHAAWLAGAYQVAQRYGSVNGHRVFRQRQNSWGLYPPALLYFAGCSDWYAWCFAGEYEEVLTHGVGCEELWACRVKTIQERRNSSVTDHNVLAREPWVFPTQGLVPYPLRIVESRHHPATQQVPSHVEWQTYGKTGMNISNNSSTCWSSKFVPKFCCAPPGFPTCFSHLMTYEVCCGELAAMVFPEEPLSHTIDVFTPAPESLRVDILVRAFYREAFMLEILLESVQLFWPSKLWQSRVIVVLDTLPQDVALCHRLPLFVTCHLEPAHDRTLTSKENAMLSLHYSDKYSNADFIAIMDADVVLFTPLIEQLVFDRTRGSPVPVMFGSWVPLFFTGPLGMGLDFVGEFMDSYPFIVRRTHFKDFRQYLMDHFNQSSFVDAWALMKERIWELCALKCWWRMNQAETVSFHQQMGTYLWHYHREDYHWSIEHGAHLGHDTSHTCPSLRVARHIASHKARVPTSGGLPPVQQAYEYKSFAYQLISAGLRGNLSVLRDALLSPGSKFSLMWASSEEHCVNRRVSNLLEGYEKAMRSTAQIATPNLACTLCSEGLA